LAPFEGGTFSHIEAVFYNLGVRAHVEIWLKLDVDAGIKHLDQAIAMTEAFSKADPDFRNAYTENAEVLNDKAFALMKLQSIYGEDHSAEICQNLSRATGLWNMVETRWGKITDYGFQQKETAYLLKQAKC
jgi:lipoprotein NlpI